MRKIYILFIICQFLFLNAQADPVKPNLFRGYIITLSGQYLTGQIGDIMINNLRKSVIFINDFGTPYMISPRLIQGFVFNDGDEDVLYQSMIVQREWVFLQVVSQGEGFCLMRSPEDQKQMSYQNGSLRTQNYRANNFYFQIGGRRATRVKRLSFRKQMSRALQERAPDLAAKIGQPGYRYRDLQRIADEYLEEMETTRIRM